LGIINPATGTQIVAVDESGITGHEVAASHDSRQAFVSIYGNSGVGAPGTDGRALAVIDIPGRKLVATLDLDKPLRPHCAVIGPKDGLLYVTTELANFPTVIGPKTLYIVASIPTDQPESHMLAIARDNTRAYTANVHAGMAGVIDLVAGKLFAIIHISPETQYISLFVEQRRDFTSEQTKPQLAVIDTGTNKIQKWILLWSVAYGTASTLEGQDCTVTLPVLGRVAVIDLASMKVIRMVRIPKFPQEILICPEGAVAYISSHESRRIAATNLKI
jgi:DNA-binding beta-propeller fold protein YncE